MKRATITLSDDLEAAVIAFQRDQAVPPTLTAITRVALEEYLRKRGYAGSAQPHRVLRLTPVPPDADSSTDVSAAHDRYFARE